ncbi:DUF484 family protein [Anianabacter salinae]|uniref:DUF484 family protein n=1 Tax=Anianabacter salinae TaxID=2851023 RepID=UPI00225E28F0|nr:DUF484 family protein [Anianabacter salinae]MBV0911647.1 DUF484 family protein [Anianabacter salinae]
MSSSAATIQEDLRARIISDPEAILGDNDLMKALLAANERVMGTNVVDLRGLAMERLEARLERLEDTHRSVIAAAYDNLSGTNQVHRAVMRLLDADSFEDFLTALEAEVPEILKVHTIRLVLETRVAPDDPVVRLLGKVLAVADPGFVDGYITQGRDVPIRRVTLRQSQPDSEVIYGDAAHDVRSEACLKLDLGDGRLPGMIALGAEDPHQFKPTQGTDLLEFFAGVFERTMRRWLA